MSVFDKAKDMAEQALGQAKEMLGQKTDNEDLEAAGKADQAEGSIKEAGHDLRDKAGSAFEDAKNKLRGN
jgi:uncharacterized protein YjbJ (UPF0337 family)